RSRIRHLQPVPGAAGRTTRISDHRTEPRFGWNEIRHQRFDRNRTQTRAMASDGRGTRRLVAQTPRRRGPRHEVEWQGTSGNPGCADEAIQKSPEAGYPDDQRRRVSDLCERLREYVRSAYTVFFAAYVREFQHQHVVVVGRN